MMSNEYYIDIVTKSILSTLSAHISEAISVELKTVMKEASLQLEAQILTTIDALNKNQLTEITSLKGELSHIKQKIDAANTTQIDSLAKSVEEQLRALPQIFQTSTQHIEKQIQNTNVILNALITGIGEIKTETANSIGGTLKELAELMQSKKSVIEETIKETVKAEIHKVESSLSANKTLMLTLLKTVFESELRNADFLAERAQNNKKELRNNLAVLEKLLDSSSQS
ncbi:hypothetical protein [Candidatus Magnetomonas plexicatena]|uniref:hypothetical protein n=1 Tax=Candidatus Magnetomonas plexicatena TaxID=2552947 RepID=UPI0011030EBF|nr:hypothetical protein E2O03_010055 [Nitrospirales bacterium LBB_01]